MPITEKRVRVTLEGNPNLKVTAKTKDHLGVNAVGGDDEVQARMLGIPGVEGPEGPVGPEGPIGPIGETGINWTGEWDALTEYNKNDAVNYFGSSYYYVNDFPSTGQPVENNPMYWDILAEKGEQGAPGASDGTNAEIQVEPTGFPNLTDSTIYVDNGTRRFYIAPTGSEYSFYIAGQEYIKTSPEYIQVPDMESVYFAYYDTDNYLKMSTSFPIPLQGKVTVAVLYWDVDSQSFTFIGEERHGLVMDWATHAYLHETAGCQYANGLDLYYTENSGVDDEDLEIGLEDGVIYDEDLRHSITNSNTPTNFFEQQLYPVAHIPVAYRDGADGGWNILPATNVALSLGTTFCHYNEWTGTTWQRTETGNNKYFTMWVFATNSIENPIVSFMGQYIDSNLEKCLEANTYATLDMGTLPSPEFKLLYRVTYRSKNNYLNSYNAAIVQVDDYRGIDDSNVSEPPTSVASGDKSFVYTQGVASDTWTINHGLNKNPSVYVIDTGGSLVEGDLQIIDINNVVLSFSAPFTGTAYFN
jgi:hypothetical protein